jgi:hypothetical protein
MKLALNDMLTFVKEDSMFGRLTSHALVETLSKIRQKIEHNAGYCEPRDPFDMVRHTHPIAPAVGDKDFTHTFAADISPLAFDAYE